MAEALASVKREFGADAVILTTRTVDRAKVLGIGGAQVVEITATADPADLPPALRARLPQRPERKPSKASERPAPAPVPRAQPQQNPVPDRAKENLRTPPARDEPSVVPPTRDPRFDEVAGTLSRETSQLIDEVGHLKSLVHKLVRRGESTGVKGLPDRLFETYQALVGNAVAEELAQKLIADVKRKLTPTQLVRPEEVRKALSECLSGMLPVADPIAARPDRLPHIVALVGPTGVGKTTTIAKLAANLSLRDHRRVGLITIDTFRIAAAEQLKVYADIIGLPLVVAAGPDQLREAVEQMSACDVILIDTAGRSQRDTHKIDELAGYFRAVRPHEVHLVLSGTVGKPTLEETIRRFKPVGIDRVIFTKLDEAVGFGVVVECLQLAQAGLSYVTTGQDVPNDIEVARADRLADLLLSGGVNDRGAGVASAGSVPESSKSERNVSGSNVSGSSVSAAGVTSAGALRRS